jgi:hypothetical protein
MSEAFSRSPPVFSAGARSTPYPTNISSMPTPHMPPPSLPPPLSSSSSSSMPNPSYSYPYVYPTANSQAIPQDIFRESIQAAILDKIRFRLNEQTQLTRAQIDSLRKTEQDLTDGAKKLQQFIDNAQQQQHQAQVFDID